MVLLPGGMDPFYESSQGYSTVTQVDSERQNCGRFIGLGIVLPRSDLSIGHWSLTVVIPEAILPSPGRMIGNKCRIAKLGFSTASVHPLAHPSHQFFVRWMTFRFNRMRQACISPLTTYCHHYQRTFPALHLHHRNY